jgi:hypothetical protein
MTVDARACTPLPPKNFHGKEGVDGSSPSEGLHKFPANGHIVLATMARFGRFAGTRRVHFWTGGHSRACATSGGTVRGVLESVDRERGVPRDAWMQRPDDDRVDRRAAVRDTPNCAGEVLDVADANLQHAWLPLVSRCTNKAVRETGLARRRKAIKTERYPPDSAGSAVTSGYAVGRGRRVRAAQTDFARAQASPTTTLMSSR